MKRSYKTRLIQVAGAGTIAGLMLALGSHSAGAVVNGGCTASGFETPANGGTPSTFPITSQSTWHVHNDSTLSGEGTAPGEQTFANVDAEVFGLGFIPIVQATGKGANGSAGPYKVSDYSKFADVIAVTGNSDNCNGSLTIIIDGVNPVGTVAGGGALALGVLGAAGVAGVALRRVGEA